VVTKGDDMNTGNESPEENDGVSTTASAPAAPDPAICTICGKRAIVGQLHGHPQSDETKEMYESLRRARLGIGVKF